jgi:hypothetical protein
LGAFETERHGGAVEPRAQRGAPGVDGLGCVRELAACTFGGSRRLAAPSRCGLRPVDPPKGRKGGVCRLCQAAAPRGCESGDKGQAR